MAEEFEKYAVLRNMFRRRSSTEFTGSGFNQIVDEKQMSTLLDEMGAHVNREELKKELEKVDQTKTGKLTFEQYTKICDQFVKDPTAVPSAMEFHSFNDFET
jgi:hypothetical protein